ncbi:hypothetical protein [Vreelandella stevensii]|uniref:hypothetical protein n=1 Tax=Vreelandella stevensii TaxID=502821 RepID=UPI0012EA3B10|nr:hypothetical protein [Halomonas stevensii]
MITYIDTSQSSVAYLDVGGTNIKIKSSNGSYNVPTSDINSLSKLISLVKNTSPYATKIVAAFAAHIGENAVFSNDIPFLNFDIDECKRIFHSQKMSLHAVNDVAAAALGATKYYSGSTLVVNLGTGTCACYLNVHDGFISILRSEFGFCAIDLDGSRLVRETIKTKKTKVHMSEEYTSLLALWLSNLSCLYLPDRIVLVGGVISADENTKALKSLSMQYAYLNRKKQTMSHQLGDIAVSLHPEPIALEGLYIIEKENIHFFNDRLLKI